MTALSSFGKLVKNVWAEYPLRMEGYFLIFIPVPLSQGEEGFLFLFVCFVFFFPVCRHFKIFIYYQLIDDCFIIFI